MHNLVVSIGFEPMLRVYSEDGLANRCLRPLGQLTILKHTHRNRTCRQDSNGGPAMCHPYLRFPAFMCFNMVEGGGVEPHPTFHQDLVFKASRRTIPAASPSIGRGAENRTQNTGIKILCDTISPHPNKDTNF